MPVTGKAVERKGSASESAPQPVAGGSRWRRVFPGYERELSVLRQWLSSLLPRCPARDDVLLVANELASNAIQHTASGRGSWFAVEVTWYQSMVRIAVADCGSQAEPSVIVDPEGEQGRGLLLVRALSARTGVTGDRRGRLVWAEVPWDDTVTAELFSPQTGCEAAISADEAALAGSSSAYRHGSDGPPWPGGR